jgi:hypothetical protein
LPVVAAELAGLTSTLYLADGTFVGVAQGHVQSPRLLT